MSNHSTLRIALGSLAVSLIVLAIKYAAYKLTGSVALYSDALESIINVATATAAIIAISFAARPADDGHPYGHHKAEYLSAVVVGALIVLAAVAILRQAYLGFMYPQPLDAPWSGMAVSTAATVLNMVWGTLLMRHGKKHRSAALVSDGRHLMADVITSVAVLIGVALVIATGITVLDSLIASLIALHVLYNGWEVIRANASGLLDESAPPQELNLIRTTIAATSTNALEVHDLRTRHAGKVTFIEFHLVVDGKMTVATSHDICDRIEAALKTAIPGAMVSIHVEPEHKAKHTGTLKSA